VFTEQEAGGLVRRARNQRTANVITLLSTQYAHFFINYQDADGATPLLYAAENGHESVTKQLLAASCNVDLQDKNGRTAMQVAEVEGHAGIATLIRTTSRRRRCVVINGLVAKPELNGRTGTAVRFDEDKGRYTVELDDTSSLIIKPCNLLPTVCSVALCCPLFSQCADTTKTLLM